MILCGGGGPKRVLIDCILLKLVSGVNKRKTTCQKKREDGAAVCCWDHCSGFSACAVGGVAKRVVIDCILLELVQV